MPDRVDVYYEGWGERWHWGTLVSSTALTRRPLIRLNTRQKPKKARLELSAYTLSPNGSPVRKDFPRHQFELPAPVYNALPDGWRMLLMDRLFKRRGLNPVRVGHLHLRAYIGSNALGALSFELVTPQVTFF